MKMLYLSPVLAILFFLLVYCQQTEGAEASPIYPKPQICKLSGERTSVKKVEVYRRKRSDRGHPWSKLPEVSGGYALIISGDRLRVYANDSDGLYYARQSLSQLLNGTKARLAQRDPFPKHTLRQIAMLGDLPEGEVIDWPDLPFRGVVEGYYGTPWSFAARRAQFEFYGRNKMNYYIYGPKDDPYHHGQGCYEPYPAAMASQIAGLVRHARKHHVNFVWAIHPANTVNWAQNEGRDDLNRLCAKLRQLYKLGVRHFGVFVDDTSGEIRHAHRQAQVCNYLLEHFIRKHPKAYQDLIMCPSGYNRGWTNPEWLGELGRHLHKDTHVMWTGDTVVHDITRSGQEWVKSHLGRPTFIWWNWPCSDFKRSRLSMGRTYGLDTAEAMRKLMTGFVANPMEQAEASKVGLFSVADYTWNITGFDSVTSWHEGIARLYPAQKKAMQFFCNHNSYLLPNVHEYYREESVDLQPTADKYRKALADGTPDKEATAAMLEEYTLMARAGDILSRAPGDTKVLAREIQPWFTQFRLTGTAGAELIRSLEGTDAERATHFVTGAAALETMKSTRRPHWNGKQVVSQTGVEVGALVVTPALQDTFRYAAQSLYRELTGKTAGGGTAAPDSAECSIGGLKLVTSRTESTVQIDPVLEQLTISPGDTITLHLPAGVLSSGVTVDLENEQVARLCRFTLTTTDGKETAARTYINGAILSVPADNMPGTPIQQVKLRYRGKQAQDFKLNDFRVDLARQTAGGDSKLLTDGDLTTFIGAQQAALSLSLPVPAGSTEVLLVGNAEASVSPASAGERSEGLQSYKLEPGTGNITIHLPKAADKRLHEVIFRR